MRSKKTIATLTKKAQTVEFPQKVTFSFDAFRIDLMAVLEENDLGGSGAWDWDEIDQVFATSWKRSESVHGFPALVSFRRAAELNPRKPLSDEIQRLLNEREAFNDDVNKATRAIAGAFLPSGV